MGEVKTNDNWDNYSSYLNLALAAISALCSAKPLSTSEFVSTTLFIKEWPFNAPTFGMFEFEFFLIIIKYSVILLFNYFQETKKRIVKNH